MITGRLCPLEDRFDVVDLFYSTIRSELALVRVKHVLQNVCKKSQQVFNSFFQKPSYKHYGPHRRQHDRRGTPSCAYDDVNWTRNPTTALLEATKGPTDTSLPGGKLAPANRRQSQTALPKRIWVQGCSSYKSEEKEMLFWFA